MFSGSGTRLQVKKEVDECKINMPEGAVTASESLDSRRLNSAIPRHWDAAQPAHECSAGPNVNKDGGAQQLVVARSTTLLFSGKGSWEAYRAQFELLAATAGWSERIKAVQLALSLTEEAADCLLLLSPEEREDYSMLVGALERRFRLFNLKDSLRCEFKHRVRRPGESLRSLAHEIESLGRRAYGCMPSSILSELVCDQFIHALTPVELRLHVQLAHPTTLSEALELALERETATCAINTSTLTPALAAAVAVKELPEQRPAWAEELVRAMKNLSVGPRESSVQLNLPAVCWGCGQPGHTLRRCPEAKSQQGNGKGSV